MNNRTQSYLLILLISIIITGHGYAAAKICVYDIDTRHVINTKSNPQRGIR